MFSLSQTITRFRTMHSQEKYKMNVRCDYCWRHLIFSWVDIEKRKTCPNCKRYVKIKLGEKLLR